MSLSDRAGVAVPLLVTPEVIAEASGGAVHAADPRLPVLIDGATNALRAWLGWHVAPVITEVMTLDGNGHTTMQLPSTHVLSVDALAINGKTIEPHLYGWSQAGMIELYSGAFPERFRSVRVMVKHGYPSLPAFASIVTNTVLGAMSSPMGATREQAGELSIAWERNGLQLTSKDKETLAPYKIQSWT